MTTTSRAAAAYLDERLRSELWSRVEERLARGESLVRWRQFHDAIETAFREFTGQDPPAGMRAVLRRMVDEVHERHPETYLAHGVQNAVNQAFGRGVGSLAWDVVTVERRGTHAVHRFLRRERIRDLFDDIRLDPGLIDVFACVQHGVAAAQPGRRRPRAGADDPVAATAAREVGEADRRQRELAALRRSLEAGERARLPEALPAYVDDGLLTPEEAEVARALAELEVRVAAGSVGRPEARSERDAIAGASARQALEAKVQAAVSGTVAALQAFAALQRIRPEYDPLLRLLIRHKAHVVGGEAGDRTPLMTALLQSGGLLELALAAIAGRDPELRGLAQRAAPYGEVAPGRLAPVPNLTIEESFVDDLRRRDSADLAQRLHHRDRFERERARADLHGLILLLDHLLEPTPFRRKIRLVGVGRALQELAPEIDRVYRTAGGGAARGQAEALLTQRLERLLVGASPEELAAARKRGQALRMAVEQKLADETQPDDAEFAHALGQLEALERGGEPAAPAAGAEAAADEELSEVELRRGAVRAEVEVRGEGGRQMVVSTVMPDPDDSQRFLIAARDPQSRQLVPQLRRGRNRYVEKRSDGSWRALTG